MSMKNFVIGVAAILVIAILIMASGCSGSGFVAVGGSGAIYNPNNEHAPKIVQQQPTQSIQLGRAKILPMVGK